MQIKTTMRYHLTIIRMAIIRKIFLSLKKNSSRTTIWPNDAILGHIGEGNHNLKWCMPPVFIATLFTTAKTWKQSTCASTDEWREKMWCTYTTYYYLAIKKRSNAICSNVDGPTDYHTKWSKRQISYDIAYTQNLNKWYKWPYL